MALQACMANGSGDGARTHARVHGQRRDPKSARRNVWKRAAGLLQYKAPHVQIDMHGVTFFSFIVLPFPLTFARKARAGHDTLPLLAPFSLPFSPLHSTDGEQCVGIYFSYSPDFSSVCPSQAAASAGTGSWPLHRTMSLSVCLPAPLSMSALRPSQKVDKGGESRFMHGVSEQLQITLRVFKAPSPPAERATNFSSPPTCQRGGV